MTGPLSAKPVCQRRPRLGTRVPCRDRCDRQRPVDGKGRVVEADGDVLGGIMLSVDSVAHVGLFGQGLKPVQKTGWHVEVRESNVVYAEGPVLPEGRGVRPDVDQDVVHRTVRTPHQLRLSPSRSSVQPAQDAASRAGLTVLHEGVRCHSVASRHCGVECPREQTSIIVHRIWYEDQDTFKVACHHVHEAMVPGALR